MRRAVLFVLALLLATVVAAQNWSGATRQKPPATPVSVAEVERGEIQTQLWHSGGLRSRDEANLAAEFGGAIVEMRSTGDTVAKGGVVVRMDTALLEQDLNVELANIKSHAARIEFLDRETARLRQLIQNNNAAVSRYEERLAELRMTRAAKSASQARAERTREMIRRMTIVAPYTGIVRRRHAEVGEWVDKGKMLVDFVGLERLEVSVAVTAQALPHIEIGDILTTKIDKVDHSATVRAIVAAADDTRLFGLRLDVDSDIGLAGQMAHVSVPISSPREALLVPEDALVIRGDGVKVFIVSDEMIARGVPVRVGLSRAARIEVIGDLEVGQKVVVRGAERLRDGMEVRFIETPKSLSPNPLSKG